MAFFIFIKNKDNIPGCLYKIAENISDLNNLNIMQSDYKIIEDSAENFNAVKLQTKIIEKYNAETIFYQNNNLSFSKKIILETIINYEKDTISNFLKNNPNHPLFNRWNDYLNQLNNLNLDSITYPLNKSLEQYFNDLGQPSLNILQLP